MTSDRVSYPHRRLGLDHSWFSFEPSHVRSPVFWPEKKHIALWITVPIEFFPMDSQPPPVKPIGFLDRGYPDFWGLSNRDYGMRIGLYRIMRVLDDLKLRATASVNAKAAEHYPRAIAEIIKCNWEIQAAGLDIGHAHHGGMPIDEERALIERSLTVLRKASNQPIFGWHSPGHSQSDNTLDLLAANQIRYVADWANDDMPYYVTTPSGPLVAMPLTYEWSDRLILVQHNLTLADYEQHIIDAFRRLETEAKQAGSGRILSISASPWLLGYPHRIAGLRRVLEYILNSGSVWCATGKEIVEVFENQTQPGRP